MEEWRKKQNEKEKVERRMKIVAGLGSVDEYIPYVQAGADELFLYNYSKITEEREEFFKKEVYKTKLKEYINTHWLSKSNMEYFISLL